MIEISKDLLKKAKKSLGDLYGIISDDSCLPVADGKYFRLNVLTMAENTYEVIADEAMPFGTEVKLVDAKYGKRAIRVESLLSTGSVEKKK